MVLLPNLVGVCDALRTLESDCCGAGGEGSTSIGLPLPPFNEEISISMPVPAPVPVVPVEADTIMGRRSPKEILCGLPGRGEMLSTLDSLFLSTYELYFLPSIRLPYQPIGPFC